MYHWNSLGSSSKVFGQSFEIFGHLQKFSEFSENVRKRSSGLRNNFGKSSEIFRKWLEIFGKSPRTPSSACLYNIKNITRYFEDINSMFSWQEQSSRHCLISSIPLPFFLVLPLPAWFTTEQDCACACTYRRFICSAKLKSCVRPWKRLTFRVNSEHKPSCKSPGFFLPVLFSAIALKNPQDNLAILAGHLVT